MTQWDLLAVMKCRISTHHELINTSQPFVPVHPPLLSRCRGRNEGKQNWGRNRNKLSQNMNLAYTILTIWNVQVYLTPGLFCGPCYMVWSLHMPTPPQLSLLLLPNALGPTRPHTYWHGYSQSMAILFQNALQRMLYVSTPGGWDTEAYTSEKFSPSAKIRSLI